MIYFVIPIVIAPTLRSDVEQQQQQTTITNVRNRCKCKNIISLRNCGICLSSQRCSTRKHPITTTLLQVLEQLKHAILPYTTHYYTTTVTTKLGREKRENKNDIDGQQSIGM